MEKKYQVFISSTYKDLIEERKKIQEILLMANCIPAGMEAFVATNDEQFNVIKQIIDLCDYYVLIIGARYGSINETTGLSYTEMEYDYAVSKNIPVLVFSLDDSIEVCDEKKEIEEFKIKKLKLFKEKAMKNRLASVWKDVSELAGQAAISIMNAIKTIDRPGWVRSNELSEYNNVNLLTQINDLRLKLKETTEELEKKEKQLEKYQNFENSDIAFDNKNFTIYASSINSNYQKMLNLRTLFGIVSLELIDGPSSITELESAVATYVSDGNTFTHLKDKSFIRKIVNQYVALGLLESSHMGFRLTKLGNKIKDEINLIKK